MDLSEVRENREIVERWRRAHARPLSRVAANLRYYAAEHGTPRVTQRLKKLPTIAHKLLREPAMKLARMADIGGVRAVLRNQDAAYGVAGRLRRNWTIARVRDYAENPKDDGYRAIHLINRHRGRLIEVQLRTPLQDVWANTVEAESRLFPGLKWGSGPPELQQYWLAVAATFAQTDRGEEVGDETLNQIETLNRRADRVRRLRLIDQ